MTKAGFYFIAAAVTPGLSSIGSDTIAFRQDGTFTQAINKATGSLEKTGTYPMAGNHLTLNYLIGPLKATVYEFSRKGDLLLLLRAGSGQAETRTLSRVQNRDAS